MRSFVLRLINFIVSPLAISLCLVDLCFVPALIIKFDCRPSCLRTFVLDHHSRILNFIV